MFVRSSVGLLLSKQKNMLLTIKEHRLYLTVTLLHVKHFYGPTGLLLSLMPLPMVLLLNHMNSAYTPPPFRTILQFSFHPYLGRLSRP